MNREQLTIIKSIFVIAITASIAGFALTQSLFRDTERSAQSAFVVGTLDMAVDGKNGTAAENITVTNLGSSAAQSGGKTWRINNVGTLPGKLSLHVENLISNENGCNEPEELVDNTCANPGANQGELGSRIATSIALTKEGSTKTIITTTLEATNAPQFAQQWETNAGAVIVPPDGQVDVTFSWEMDDAEYDNSIQSDDVTFDLVFDLKQVPL